MRINLKNNPAKFHLDPMWKSLLEQRRLIKKKANKTSVP